MSITNDFAGSFIPRRELTSEEKEVIEDFRADFHSYMESIDELINNCREKSLVRSELESVMHRIEDAVHQAGLRPAAP